MTYKKIKKIMTMLKLSLFVLISCTFLSNLYASTMVYSPYDMPGTKFKIEIKDIVRNKSDNLIVITTTPLADSKKVNHLIHVTNENFALEIQENDKSYVKNVHVFFSKDAETESYVYLNRNTKIKKILLKK